MNKSKVKGKKAKLVAAAGALFSLCLCFSAVNVIAQPQSGGQFAIKQTVVSNGGGVSTGGQFGTTTTAGQPAAGISSTNAPLNERSGFWQANLTPTSAGVAVSGRVTTVNGAGVRNAIVVLTNSNGVTLSVRTSSFGYYRFEDVAVGQTYVISIRSKRYTFTPRIIAVSDELTDINFVTDPQ